MIEDKIVQTVRSFYPEIQAIYLFGSYGTEYEQVDSDVDIALLFSPREAKRIGILTLGRCWSALADVTDRSVDLINLRLVNTLFQHEIIQQGRILFEADGSGVGIFEMLTLSFYQKLNEERKEIIEEVIQSKRVLKI